MGQSSQGAGEKCMFSRPPRPTEPELLSFPKPSSESLAALLGGDAQVERNPEFLQKVGVGVRVGGWGKSL